MEGEKDRKGQVKTLIFSFGKLKNQLEILTPVNGTRD